MTDTLRGLSLFAGYGGLTKALEDVLALEVAAYAETAETAAATFARHWPAAVNVGDVTTADWSALGPIDVIDGGSPCQDLSPAGLRAGMMPGTRSGLWASMARAIDVLRPRLVVWENVRGALSAKAASGVEFCPGCMGDGGPPPMRAPGRVIGDLATLGYDAGWVTVAASDVGACHQRARLFVVAAPADAHGAGWLQQWRGVPTTPQQSPAQRPGADPLTLLPTPTVVDMGRNKTLPEWEAWTATQRAKHHNGNGHGKSLDVEARRLVPLEAWGAYGPAIERHERAFGMIAPHPTMPGAKGPRLSPYFAEWMMGMPRGWIVDTPGVTPNAALKMAGNGVVPQQAAAAVSAILEDFEGVTAA